MTPVRRVAALGALWLAAACVSARADTVQISMENLEITPTVVSARLGDTVEWVNKDAFAHTATARNGDFRRDPTAKENGERSFEEGGDSRLLLSVPSQYEGNPQNRALIVTVS
jgi:plastocyanin